MTDIQREELERCFSPIYYVEYEVTPAGELFPQRFRVAYYHERAKKEALQCFEQFNGVRVIEKSMRTGQEKIIKERATA